ncbi:MAG: Sau3AI family type II restriction endonuclease [Flavobacteriaceae bacterium]
MLKPNYNPNSRNSILRFAKRLEKSSLSKSCGEIPIPSKKNKGNFGNLLEEFYFGYKPNSNSEADFKEAELELKSTPLKQLKNGNWVCKERLVLNIINYIDLPNEDFLNSSFWKKNKNLLLVFYLWNNNQIPIDYVIDLVDVWGFPTKDLKIIQKDWNSIKSKVENGNAHLISEGDTFYLGACTKGSTAEKSLREQPFSHLLAKQRAYSLKRSYLNTIYETLKGNQGYESILSEDELELSSIDDLVLRKFKPFYGLSNLEIQNKLGTLFNRKSKNYFNSITKRILGVSEDSFIEEFEKANITIKSVRIELNGKIKENISFPSFKFEEIIKEDWENSITKDLIENKFLFIFYKKTKNKNFILDKSMFWNLSSSDLDEFERVFEITKSIILNGNIVNRISNKGIVYNNFPKSSGSYLTHIRPHARNRNDTYPLPIEDRVSKKSEFTKQCFWLNSSYVERIYNSN